MATRYFKKATMQPVPRMTSSSTQAVGNTDVQSASKSSGPRSCFCQWVPVLAIGHRSRLTIIGCSYWITTLDRHKHPTMLTKVLPTTPTIWTDSEISCWGSEEGVLSNVSSQYASAVLTRVWNKGPGWTKWLWSGPNPPQKAWCTWVGSGSPGATWTLIFVTVPAGTLTPDGQDSGERGNPNFVLV